MYRTGFYRIEVVVVARKESQPAVQAASCAGCELCGREPALPAFSTGAHTLKRACAVPCLVYEIEVLFYNVHFHSDKVVLNFLCGIFLREKEKGIVDMISYFKSSQNAFENAESPEVHRAERLYLMDSSRSWKR